MRINPRMWWATLLILPFVLNDIRARLVKPTNRRRPAESNTSHNSAGTLPIVLWHGMGDSCCNPLSMGYVKKLLKRHIPDVYVNSLMFGKNFIEDTESGFFGNMNSIVEQACRMIADDERLRGGYNAIGFSQGSLFLRAVAQRCPQPPMRTLISIGGPQQGIYGFPYCIGNSSLCNAVRHFLEYGAYATFVQKISVQAQYWHDPDPASGYATRSAFLADLNCANAESSCNPSYKSNLLKLENLVLVKFLRDEMVIPKESEWFGYYTKGTTEVVDPMNKTELYQDDLIGLKVLQDSGRLHFISVDGRHLQIPQEKFVQLIIDPYLKKKNRSSGRQASSSSDYDSQEDDE